MKENHTSRYQERRREERKSKCTEMKGNLRGQGVLASKGAQIASVPLLALTNSIDTVRAVLLM